ncbi:MAG TPA: AarF/UbiB family protein [Mycobacteriales bacterium]|nr:AarF/UbiB family protein [Mycobacteriales bacterium]
MGISLKPQHLKRYKDIAVLLARYGRSDLVSQVGLDEVDSAPASAETVADAEHLAADLERLGPTYIKLGQLMSTRADLLPPAYITALSRLQDDVAPFPFEEVERIVESELGARISRAFQIFENVPLASASLGQVHRAVLRNGRQVAVKVQRPGIRDTILDDLDALREIAEFADAHTSAGRRYGFAAMLEEFRKSMLRELDYQQEARNLETLRANLAEYPRIDVPAPVADYTTSRVLTMDFVGGRKLTSLGPLAQLEVEGNELADQLIGAYLKQILVDGFFHADPHPGNVFLTETGNIALIDLGMIGRVPPAMQEELLKLLLAVGEGRGDDAARTLQSLADRIDDELDEGTFRRAIGEIVAEHQGAALAQIRAGAVIIDLSTVAVQNGLRPPPELTMLGRALIALDEVARTLDPHYDPNEAIRRQAADILRRRLAGTASQGNIFASVLEAKEFVERLPGRVNRVMDALAEGEIKLNVRGIDERELMFGVTKLANRLTTGVVIAALIVGAAMLMRVPTKTTLFGYPALAIVCFLLAAAFGVVLLANIWLTDRKAGQTRRAARRR